MQAGFFEWLGEALGSAIRFIIDALGGAFTLLTEAGTDFIEGLSRALGMNPSFLGLVVLIIGLLLLFLAARSLLRRAFISGVLLALLGLWLLSWVVA